ncbi:MAG: gamma carbonic anhydrase family protein [Halofilum sp. (in: g-proteobacteria)]|nr:gamma carbonic anhydrase family protein [Halofilum sp. (in: g-proteobacteria)]
MTLRTFEQIDPHVPDDAFVDPAALLIGDVALGAQSSVWPFCVLRGDVQVIRVGARTNIQDGTIVHVAHDGGANPAGGLATEIGDDVTIGHRAVVHACTIEDRVLVGMGAIVMDGATVRSDVIIGAGALVPPGKELESGWLYLGSPVKAARELTDEERGMFEYQAKHYAELAKRHAGEANGNRE